MKTKKQRTYIFVVLSLAVRLALADEVPETSTQKMVEPSFCKTAQSLNNLQKPVYFTQQTVEDGTQALVIVAPDELNRQIIKRITYQQNKEAVCHYPAIAITRGGDWGWFLAWADAEKVYFTRMDAEALVFAPLKSLPIAHVVDIEFLSGRSEPSMQIHHQDGQTQFLSSDDEGRHWQVTP